MKRYLSASTILIIFLIFAGFIVTQKRTNIVYDVINPTTFEVDLNNNGIIDDGETVCIPSIETFSTNLSGNKPRFITEEMSPRDVISLGYLTEEYSKNLLLLRSVKVKFNGNTNQDCKYGEIFIENEKYSDKIVESGFASRDNYYNKEKLAEKLKLIKKLNLTILNLKSFKYHKTNCEYGVQSSDYTLIPASQLPKEAKPCKFCHVKRGKAPTETTQVLKSDTSSSTNNIKLILTDLTTTLKPNRECKSEVCLSLLKEINNAEKSIDMAIYGYSNIPEIQRALVKAKERGVKLRIVYDANNSGKHYYSETASLINIADVSKSDKNFDSATLTDQLMHNKFIIFDNQTVMTGSMNLSSTGLSGYNSNVILFINSQDLAELYTAEFEQMLSGKFHSLKSNLGLQNHFKLNDTNLSVYFSPYDKSMQKVITLIDFAQNYIYIPAFLITHKDLTAALIRAKARGVEIKIIIDANSTGTKNTKHALLRQNGIQLKTENFAGKLHSKSIIIDDKYIVAGSMNFSNSGENKNDENLLIIENSKLAITYKNFFEYLWRKIPDKWLTQNAMAESKDSVGSCSDGIDNDFDGLIDNADNSCW